MSQYKTGTVDVTNGSANVVGNGTLFIANVSAGDLFTVVGDNVFYEVASNPGSDTALTLTANYAGTTKTGRAYTIARDFTPNLGFPIPNQGDVQAALVIKRALVSIDTEFNTAGLVGDGREWIDLKLTPTFLTATTFKVTGDKTAEYHVDRRVKCIDATNLFGRITATSFAAGETTVTVVLDSGSLTASLSKVAVGIASANSQHSISGDAVRGGAPKVDTIDEDVAGAGVTVDGVKLKDGGITATAQIDAGTNKIVNVVNPTAAQDAATKNYVDSFGAGIDWKLSVRGATVGNVTLSSQQTIDGVFLTAGQRILVKNQTTGSENGIYDVATGAWSRSSDADADADVTAGLAVFVEEGTTNADTGWVLTTDDPITVGTTALTFTQFTGIAALIAGAGLTKTGNTVDAIANADGSITVNADDIQVGVLATDAQHGTRGGGSQHADVVAAGADGFMTGSDKTKLDGIESSATADQTNAEIKTAYEANANTNEFDDAEQTKLVGIEAGAEINDGAFRSVQIFTADGTYTKPAGLVRAVVKLVGGGGAGGGALATAGGEVSGGGGGGAGGYAFELLAAGAIGATETVTVGAGGTGVSGGSGNPGATTSFGALLSATGGVGGLASAAASGFHVAGSAGGSGSGGNLNTEGGGSGAAGGDTSQGISGIGGSSYLGGGARGMNFNNAGIAGAALGSGGSGACNFTSQAARTGGTGKVGVIIVWEYF